MDDRRLNTFLERILSDLGGASALGPVRIGAALGLYRALRDHGPMTSLGLAEATGLAERYVREWLCHQAASHYVSYDGVTARFTLPPEHAAVLVDEDSPVFMLDAFDAVVAYLENQPKVQAAFRTGEGVAYGDQSGCLFCAIARFFRPGYRSNLVASWLPALDGVIAKLERGALVADVGCGHGYSTVMMADAFPNSTFIGFDFHQESIDAARRHAAEHDVLGNVRFEVARAQDYPGDGFDLVTFFDCLHDMGDPVGAARHVRRSLRKDGTWMIVEPYARDRLEQNLTPVSRLYYAASTMVCVPASLGQEVGAALGAQAGERRMREVVVDDGGFSRLRRATETPFNLVLEARP
jgi:SAM-dependent methyltransferase